MKEELIGYKVDKGEEQIEAHIRPRCLSEYIGQDDLKSNLEVFIKAARNCSRGNPLPLNGRI